MYPPKTALGETVARAMGQPVGTVVPPLTYEVYTLDRWGHEFDTQVVTGMKGVMSHLMWYCAAYQEHFPTEPVTFHYRLAEWQEADCYPAPRSLTPC